jgi:ABC-type Fe3+ transport system permease subunit
MCFVVALVAVALTSLILLAVESIGFEGDEGTSVEHRAKSFVTSPSGSLLFIGLTAVVIGAVVTAAFGFALHRFPVVRDTLRWLRGRAA